MERVLSVKAPPHEGHFQQLLLPGGPEPGLPADQPGTSEDILIVAKSRKHGSAGRALIGPGFPNVVFFRETEICIPNN